jgi:hypothetical protein
MNTSDPILEGILDPESAAPGLPLYSGFPYLLTRVVDALRHIILLPEPWTGDTDRLLRIARGQVRANQLETALVLAPDRSVFISSAGVSSESVGAPRGGILLVGRLEPFVEIKPSQELQARRDDLAAWMKCNQVNDGFMLGDRAASGHEASPNELRTLRGENDAGLPIGLGPCPMCGEVRGECLDTNPQFPGLVISVHCPCDNENRCARCGEHLNDRRLNGNYYCRSDGHIWHTPGFCGLKHRCADRR